MATITTEKLGAITTVAIEDGSELREYRVLNATQEWINAGLATRGFNVVGWTYTTDGDAIYGNATLEISTN